MNPIDWVACERLVSSIASKFVRDGVDLEDLKQEATIAVLESHADYIADMGVSLNTYLGRRIRDALRSYLSLNLDAVEIDRKWVAEPIDEHPRESIKANTREECEALREFHGAHRFKEPRRVVVTIKATSSLDEGWETPLEEDNSFHETLGVGPGQEAVLQAKAEASAMKNVSAAASVAGRGAVKWEEMLALRASGLTLAQVAERTGAKSAQSVFNSLAKAKKRLEKKNGAAA